MSYRGPSEPWGDDLPRCQLGVHDGDLRRAFRISRASGPLWVEGYVGDILGYCRNLIEKPLVPNPQNNRTPTKTPILNQRFLNQAPTLPFLGVRPSGWVRPKTGGDLVEPRPASGKYPDLPNALD